MSELLPTKEKKTKIGLLITVIINVIIVAVIIIKEAGSWSQTSEKISLYGIRPFYIVCGALCFCASLFSEFGKYNMLIRFCSGKENKTVAYRTAVIGRYTDNVTPFSAGGQPFQIHYLYKCGYPSGVSAAVPVIGFMSLQLSFLLIAIVVFALSFTVRVTTFFRVSAVIGLLFYLFVPLMIVFFVFWPAPCRAAVGGVLKLLEKIRLVKDSEKKTESFCASLDEYVVSFKTVNKKPSVVVRLALYSLVYQISTMSIPFFMLKAFGSTESFLNVFFLTVFIYASITVIPTPGNAGAAEGAFYAVFSSLEGGPLVTAMILWRALVYYTWIILGIITYTRKAVRPKNKEP